MIAVTFWSLRWYRASTVALLFFWLDISLLMFLGVGLLRSVYVVSSDACLYAEYSSMVLADRKVAATRRERVRPTCMSMPHLPGRHVVQAARWCVSSCVAGAFNFQLLLWLACDSRCNGDGLADRRSNLLAPRVCVCEYVQRFNSNALTDKMRLCQSCHACAVIAQIRRVSRCLGSGCQDGGGRRQEASAWAGGRRLAGAGGRRQGQEAGAGGRPPCTVVDGCHLSMTRCPAALNLLWIVTICGWFPSL